MPPPQKPRLYRFTEADTDNRHAEDLERMIANDQDYFILSDFTAAWRVYVRRDYFKDLKDEVVTDLATHRIKEIFDHRDSRQERT